jgi:inner membrane protein
MNDQSSFLNNKGIKLTLKLFFVGFIGILMLIATALVNSVVSERENYRTQATTSISNSWGSEQLITPPILTIPFQTIYKNPKDKSVSSATSYAHFLPNELKIQSSIKPEIRYKGIFKKIVYTTDIKIEGSFPPPVINKSGTTDEINILWNNAFIALGITDTKGLQGQPTIEIDGSKHYFQPGTSKQTLFSNGINVPLNYTALNGKSNKFSMQLTLRGSDSLSFIPTGQTTKASVNSSWPNPSFIGSFLPSKKVVTDKSFKAEWDISYLARSFPQSWVDSLGDKSRSVDDAAFGASLLTPVDFYRNTLRAIKYSILFIALTFLTFFMFEVIAKLKIHAFQYFLVGMAVSLFYLILLSLSEFIGFNWAYILASIGNIFLISLYTKAIVKNIKPILTYFMTGVLVFLYSFLYVLLQLQDLSLLIGSIGLFIVLALVMYFTRNIDWFEQKDV